MKNKALYSLYSKSGQALIETVFIIVIFVTIFFAILNLTFLANAKALTNAAAYAACRSYIVTYSKSKATFAAGVYLTPMIKSGDLLFFRVSIKPGSDPGFGKKIKTTVKTRFRPIYLPTFFWKLPKFFKMQSSCTMTME